MADFALWATACETNLWPAGTFTRAYAANRKAAIESIIEADPIAACVREFMSERPSWTGSAADLLRVSVERSSDRIPRDGTGWPKSPRALAATCVAHRRFFGRSVSRLRSVVKAEPEAE